MIIFEGEPTEFLPEDLSHLRSILGGQIEPRTDGWVISRVAGHVELPTGTQLSIRSRKAPLASLLTWMAYVDPALQSLRFLGASEKAAAEGELGAVLARLFVLELLEQISRQGVNRRYVRTQPVDSGDLPYRCKRGFALFLAQLNHCPV